LKAIVVGSTSTGIVCRTMLPSKRSAAESNAFAAPTASTTAQLRALLAGRAAGDLVDQSLVVPAHPPSAR
jgi:hypothetical protein